MERDPLPSMDTTTTKICEAEKNNDDDDDVLEQWEVIEMIMASPGRWTMSELSKKASERERKKSTTGELFLPLHIGQMCIVRCASSHSFARSTSDNEWTNEQERRVQLTGQGKRERYLSETSQQVCLCARFSSLFHSYVCKQTTRRKTNDTVNITKGSIFN